MNRWLHRYACLLAATTFFLIVVEIGRAHV